MKSETSEPTVFKLDQFLTAQFKEGSIWIKQQQRYGELEITPRALTNLAYLADKHGMIKQEVGE